MEVAKHTDEASNKDWRRVGREVGRLGLGLFFFFLYCGFVVCFSPPLENMGFYMFLVFIKFSMKNTLQDSLSAKTPYLDVIK